MLVLVHLDLFSCLNASLIALESEPYTCLKVKHVFNRKGNVFVEKGKSVNSGYVGSVVENPQSCSVVPCTSRESMEISNVVISWNIVCPSPNTHAHTKGEGLVLTCSRVVLFLPFFCIMYRCGH